MKTAAWTHIALPAPIAGAASFLNRVALAIRVAGERRTLGHLDDRTLEDIGLTREQVDAEAGRAPWDLPAGR